MKTPTRVLHAATLLAGLLVLAGCHAASSPLGQREGRLAGCPETYNCVSSQATDKTHRIAPIRFSGSSAAAIDRLAEIVRSLPRATVITATENYLHAEFRSAVFGFVDDVEFLADEASGTIQVRSASRIGYSDLGVNRRRMETIHERWDEAPSR